jgi:hypothetical protein
MNVLFLLLFNAHSALCTVTVYCVLFCVLCTVTVYCDTGRVPASRGRAFRCKSSSAFVGLRALRFNPSRGRAKNNLPFLIH